MKPGLLLLPLAGIYDAITRLRNFAFDCGWLSSYQAKVPCIAVGNLSMGGTGKTPMIEFLISSQLPKKIGVVSRGYGRKTKGLLAVNPKGSAQDYGDECLQIAQKFPVQVWVSEKRALGVKAAEAAGCELILLDDAFQHRYVKAHYYLLLSTFQKPFFKDWIVPAGSLRESRKGAARSQALIITKSPLRLSADEIKAYQLAARKYSPAPLYFSSLSYGAITNQFGEELPPKTKVALISGIAHTQALVKALQERCQLMEHWNYGDHHDYKLSELKNHLAKAKQENWALVCTDKDRVKLSPLLVQLDPKFPLYTLPVKHQFSGEDEKRLLRDIESLF
jgi:tetraacyldisaccharide 4'-kinase